MKEYFELLITLGIFSAGVSAYFIQKDLRKEERLKKLAELHQQKEDEEKRFHIFLTENMEDFYTPEDSQFLQKWKSKEKKYLTHYGFILSLYYRLSALAKMNIIFQEKLIAFAEAQLAPTEQKIVWKMGIGSWDIHVMDALKTNLESLGTPEIQERFKARIDKILNFQNQ